MRRHRPWFSLLRRPLFIAVAFIALIAYALFLLPDKDSAPPLWFHFSIGLFIILVLGCSGSILADKDKPELLKMATAVLLIAVLCWLFYRYSGTEWDKLSKHEWKDKTR